MVIKTVGACFPVPREGLEDDRYQKKKMRRLIESSTLLSLFSYRSVFAEERGYIYIYIISMQKYLAGDGMYCMLQY